MTDTPLGGTHDRIDLRPGAAADADARTMLLVIYGLYFAGFVSSGLTTLIGVVMAYAFRGAAPDWAQSHYRFQIRTFWMILAAFALMVGYALISVPLVLVLIGIPMLMLLVPASIALAVWYGARTCTGFVRALDSRPHDDPETFLI